MPDSTHTAESVRETLRRAQERAAGCRRSGLERARDVEALGILNIAITKALTALESLERDRGAWLDLVLAMNGLPKGATIYHTVDGGWTLYTKDGGGHYEAGQRIKFRSTGDLFDGIMGIKRDPADAILGAPTEETGS